MISREPPREAVAILPVWATVGEACRIVFSKLPALAKIAVIPVSLSFGFAISAEHLALPYPYIVWALSLSLPWTLLGVPWVRLIVLHENDSTGRFFYQPARRHLRFLAYSLVLSIVDLPVLLFPYFTRDMAVEEMVLWAVYWALLLIAIYIKARFSFIFIAASIDENYSLALAWRHSRGIGLRLFLVIMTAVMVPWYAADYVLGRFQGGADLVGLIIVTAVIWHIGLWTINALYLAAVAIAFRTCTGWVPGPDRRVIERFE